MDIKASRQLAEFFVDKLSPSCQRIEIVGSNKRFDKDEAHDIEILLIPKHGAPVPSFGRKVVHRSHFDAALAQLHEEGLLKHPLRKADGSKYKKRALCNAGQLAEFCLDLFIVTPQTWAIQNVIRTGPSLFSHRFVTNRSKTVWIRETGETYPGLLPDQYEYVKGDTVIKLNGKVLELREEADAIELLGEGWIAPSERRKRSQRT